MPEPLCGGDGTRRADRNRRPREPRRMERRPARERRIRRLRLLQDGRTQFGGCPLHGAPSGWREPFRGQSDHGRRHMDLSGDIPLRGGTKSCVGHAEQPLVEKEPRRDGRRREDRRRHGQRRPHACCGVPHAGYRLFLRAERLSPFLRGRPLLAAMGGISRNGLPSEGGARRLQGGLHVARPLGQRAHGRLRTAARRRGSEHSRRHGAGLPLRRRRAPQRRDDRHAGHLLHTGERRPLRRRCQPLPVA